MKACYGMENEEEPDLPDDWESDEETKEMGSGDYCTCSNGCMSCLGLSNKDFF
jgi:hypothetical protein